MVGLGRSNGLSRKEYSKKWKELNKAHCKKANASWYQKNKERHRQQNLRWQRQNPGRMNEIRNKWKDANPEKNLLKNARNRARELGVPFSICLDDIVIPEHCPVLGTKLIWRRTGKRGNFIPAECPSLDRFDPKLGYVKGNVCVISWRANWLKRDGTFAEFERLVDWMRHKAFPSRSHASE